MIESVRIFKKGKGVNVRYKSGNTKMFIDIPQTVLDFILREDVKAYENEDSILYRVA